MPRNAGQGDSFSAGDAVFSTPNLPQRLEFCMALNRDNLHNFLQNDLGVDVSKIDDSSPLFSSGVIDSFSLVSLITFVERQCGMRMNPGDVNLENLDSVDRILAFATRMQQVSPQ